MKKTLINEVRQLQKIAGILKENEDNVIPGGPDWVSLSVFLEALGLNPKDPIFQGAMKNRDIEELLQMIEDTAGLDQYTKSDLIDAMEEAQFSQDMIDFIIDENPLVKGLERGLMEDENSDSETVQQAFQKAGIDMNKPIHVVQSGEEEGEPFKANPKAFLADLDQEIKDYDEQNEDPEFPSGIAYDYEASDIHSPEEAGLPRSVVAKLAVMFGEDFEYIIFQ